MDENLCCDVSYCGTKNKDVQAWVVMSDELLLEMSIYDDEEKADFMYQSLGGDALLFYDKLPMHVQYSWQLMKVVLLKHYVELEVATMQSRCFHGTDEECIKSWIAQVEEEMMHLNIVDDGARADFASQGLSYDAFVIMHMLPDDWLLNFLPGLLNFLPINCRPMTNLALQGVVHKQMQHRHLAIPALKENFPTNSSLLKPHCPKLGTTIDMHPTSPLMNYCI
ncbi:hypothetical protein L7F22_014284 [Adiantum nelumboides]|nr:hypothetical protein [Adiantum nelumboides]